MAKTSSVGDFGFPVVFKLEMSAANTLTYETLQTGLSPKDRIGWVIQRVEVQLAGGTLGLFNSTADTLQFGLVQNNTLTTLSQENPQVKYTRKLERIDYGIAASGFIADMTYFDDFSGLSGGGILIVPQPLYGFITSTGLSAAATVALKVYIKEIQLSDSDYFNIVQNTQIMLSQ